MPEPCPPSLDERLAAAAPDSVLRVELLRRRLHEGLLGVAATVVPTRLGRFEIEGRIGAGGMGEVYRARDPLLGRDVAVKLVRTSTSAQTTAIVHEAKALAQLRHPNVVAVYDVGGVGAGLFLAMEYVPGTTLAQWLVEPSSWRDVVAAFVDAGRGLAAAHVAGVIHGDFKPSNVLRRTDGRVVVIDFGLARVLRTRDTEPSDDASSSPPRGGTVGYAAPELLAGAAADEASDQYAFCVALREALVGRTGPRTVSQAVERGCSPDPADRWRSMDELVEVLRDAGRRRSPWATVVVASVIAVPGALLAMRSAAQRGPDCSDAAAAVDAAWNDDRRSAVRESFAAIDAPFALDVHARVDAVLVAYARELTAAIVDRCAAGVRPEDDRARTVCLDERTRALRALVGELDGALDPGRAARAIGSAHDLPRIAMCSDDAWLRAAVAPAADPEIRAQVDEIERGLDRLRENLNSGNGRDAIADAERLLADAERIGDGPIHARALNDLATMHQLAGHYDAAQPLLEEAFFAAKSERLDVLALKIASNLVALHDRLGHYEDALAWERHAQTLIDRAPDPIVASKLQYNVSVVLQELGRLPEARERLERVLEVRMQVLGPEDPTTANAMFELANVRVAEGDDAGALPDFERALAIYEAAYGPDHPTVANVLNNMANSMARADDLLGARDRYRRAQAIREQVLGPMHPSLGGTLANLGRIELDLGDVEAAHRDAARSLAIRRAALGPAHPELVSSLTVVARVALAQGKLDDAATTIDEALAIAEQAKMPPRDALAVAIEIARARDDAATARLHEQRLRALEESGKIAAGG